MADALAALAGPSDPGTAQPTPTPSAPTTPPPAQPPAPTPDPAPAAGDRGPVPYDRFKEVNDRARAAEKAAAEAQARLDAAEQATMSEQQKAERRAAAAEAKAAEAEAKAMSLERGGWVREAARAAGFTDPEDAVVNLDLNTLESAEQVQEAVQALAARKPHYLSAQGQQVQRSGPTAFGAPSPAPGVVTNVNPLTGLPVDGNDPEAAKRGFAGDMLSWLRS